MADDLYRVKTLFNIRQFVVQHEEITCLDGSLETLTIGTSLGRVLCLKTSAEVVSLESVLQLSTQNLAVSHLVHASAFGYILALISPKLYLVEKESRKVHCASINTNVMAFALNTNPAVDSPFVLQFALSTSEKQIIVYNLQEKDLVVVSKFTVEDSAISLCYSRHCICFATSHFYFVHDLVSNVTRSLFPYETVVTRPIIVNIDVNEFLLNGMQGLGVFATASGVSSRPPIVWGSERIISLAYHSNTVYVLNTASLIVFDCVGNIGEVQRFPVNGGRLLQNLDGQIVLCTNEQFFLLEEIRWFERAERMLSVDKLDEALRIAEEAVYRSEDRATFLKANDIKEKAAMKYFFAEEFDRCRKLLEETGMDPRKVIVYYKNLVPLPSGFNCLSNDDMSTEDEETLDEKYLAFLEEYLKAVRKQSWGESCCRDIDAVLLRLMALKKETFDHELCSGLRCSCEDFEQWTLKNSYLQYFLMFAISVGTFEKALELGREILAQDRLDKNLLLFYISSLIRIRNENLLAETLKFLVEINAKMVLQNAEEPLLKAFRTQLLAWLKQEDTVLIPILERWRGLKETEVDTRLLQIYISELKRSSDEVLQDNRLEYRKKMRKILLESNVYDKRKILPMVQSSPMFKVECVLLRAKENGQAESCMEELLRDYKDFDAAELLCSHMGTGCPKLYRVLLKFYIRAASERPEFDLRTTTLLDTMSATTTADLVEILSDVPSTWLFKRLAKYAEKTVLNAENRHTSNCLKDAVQFIAKRQLSETRKQKSAKSVAVDEHTYCSVCGKQLSAANISYNFKSKKFSHIDCRSEMDATLDPLIL